MEIAKSKQLLNKSKPPRNKRLQDKTRRPRATASTPSQNAIPNCTTSTSRINNNGPKFCSNSKPMPSLAELEKMYDGSDDDELPLLPSKPRPKLQQPAEQSPPPTDLPPERSKTPEQPTIIDLDKLRSPTTVKDISQKVIDYIENLPNNVDLTENGPPPPIVPPKKRQKPMVPYIVGCKDRAQRKDWISSAIIGAGDPKYGVQPNYDEEDEEMSPKKHKKSNIPTPQYSHFNAQSEEIAANLRANEVLSESSNDSTKTVSYEFPRGFSPVPSTSNNDDVFMQNEMRFNESLKREILNDTNHSDLEIIEVPRETITIDDDDATTSNDSGVQVVDPDVKEVKPIPRAITTIDLLGDDPYSSITNIDLDNDSSVCEVIDVDDIIATHQTVLNKYKRESTQAGVTFVEPTTDVPVQAPAQTINPTDIKGTAGKIMNILQNFFNRNGEIMSNSNEKDESTVDKIKQLSESIASNYKGPINVESGLSSSAGDLRNTDEVVVIASPQTPQNLQPSVSKRGRGRPRDTTKKRSHSDLSSRTILDLSTPQTPNTPKRDRPRDKKRKNSILPAMTLNPIQAVQSTASVAHSSSILPSPQTPARSIGECPICMENLSNKSIASTVCGHIFCLDCIKAAVKSTGKKCPTCRKKLTGVGFHQIFL